MTADESTACPQTDVFFPALRLARSRESHTRNRVLYSVSTSSRFGRASKIGLYIHPEELPVRRPEEIEIMVHKAEPVAATGRICLLQFCPGERDTSYRYEESGVHDRLAVGTVYLPKGMFRGTPPDRCWLELRIR